MRQQKSKGAPAKNQAVNRDADGIAGQHPHPLIPGRDAALPQVVDFSVNQLTEDLSHNTGDDDSPYRAEDGGKFFSQTPGRILGQPGDEVKKKRHEEVDARCQKNNLTGRQLDRKSVV